MSTRKKMTIYTLAEELGISPSTVSKVVNNTGKVSDRTRKRVLEYIKKVGYVPSTSARMLKSKSTRTIGIVFTEELGIGLEHSFFSSILQHFKTYMESEGYDLTFIVPKMGKSRLTYYQWCLNKRVDGVFIVVGDYNDKDIYELVDSGIPCVSTDMILNNLHAVVSDNDQGVNLIVKYIKEELKLTKVGMIVGPQHSKAFKERYQSFIKYMEEYNLEINEKYIIEVSGFGFTSGYRAALELIKNELPEVIFVSSDEIAVGFIKALRENNVEIPKDLQIIGFDDIVIAKHITPSITTIQQNTKELGEEAAKTLLSLIEPNKTTPSHIKRIPVKLVERESTIKK